MELKNCLTIILDGLCFSYLIKKLVVELLLYNLNLTLNFKITFWPQILLNSKLLEKYYLLLFKNTNRTHVNRSCHRVNVCLKVFKNKYKTFNVFSAIKIPNFISTCCK